MFSICRINVISLLLTDARSWCHLFPSTKETPITAFSLLRRAHSDSAAAVN